MSEKTRITGGIETKQFSSSPNESVVSDNIDRGSVLWADNKQFNIDFDINSDDNRLDCSGLNIFSQLTPSEIPVTLNESTILAPKPNINLPYSIQKGASCRFPKLEECAHFHYERVKLGSLSVCLADDKSDILNNSIASQSISGELISNSFSLNQGNKLNTTFWFIIKVTPSRSDAFYIKRSFGNLKMLDEMLHRCVYDRKISMLKSLDSLEDFDFEDIEYAIAKYLERFSKIASDSLTCGTILTWLQLDNKGRRLPLADTDTMRSINTPAVGAAYGVRRYIAQACDEISIEVGDMISVIDMPSPAESIWWRGKKSHLQKSQYEVGFFPQNCVATIGDKVPRHFPLPAPLVGQLDASPTKPVLRKHGKLIAFFRSFILSRPSRRRLKQTGIYKERVFSCDLSEHLLNTGQDIPMVLKCCAEFIEENGIVDGIYRLSGITSNIQKLRRAFDEERIPDLAHPEIKQDIHAVSSLLKMYFRELPNPLCTYQLYDNFVEAIQSKSDPKQRLKLMKETVLKLPPPHYRTLKYLATHLGEISKHSANTGMTDKNLAIVWAPNLLRSPSIESGGVAALRGVGIQAVVTEFLIKNSALIFDSSDENSRNFITDCKIDSLTDCESLLVEQREYDQSLSLIERPKSLSACGAKLISLEEAQERHSRSDSSSATVDILNNKTIPINNAGNVNIVGSYIEVGGGPSSLPDKYHTVLPVPRSWQKRKTHSWKSLFSRNTNARNSAATNTNDKINISLPKQSLTNDIMDGDIEENTNPAFRSLEKQKSVDILDAKAPIESCVRSNSVESLRTGTAGHSRSVSHDSYFDLLQSPIRGSNGSREFSELGLNFDREEPEMRIFSESESLVSSPKVCGNNENILPRRILRARPEEFSSAGNSVNPSPKKQPRLLNPNDVPSSKSWSEASTNINKPVSDASGCKRYKLEDQLSDIQYIDCSTPEHVATINTLYTSVQIHNPPPLSQNFTSVDEVCNKREKNTSTSVTFESIFDDSNFDRSERLFSNARYSYPGVQKKNKIGLLNVSADQKELNMILKEGLSYPGLLNSCTFKNINKPELDLQRNNNENQERVQQDNTIEKNFSKCNHNETTAAPKFTGYNCSIHKNTFTEVTKNPKCEMEVSKISVATSSSSPVQSPRYSLLLGETSSENSSAVNTPIFEKESLIEETDINEKEDLIKLYDSKDLSENLYIKLSQNKTDKRDITLLKRELSLDLNSHHHNYIDIGRKKRESDDIALIPQRQESVQYITIPTSPNNSNLTHTSDTSQSITPSEFGYQNFDKLPISSMSTTDSSPNVNSYDHYFLDQQNFYSVGNEKTITPTCPTGTLISPLKTTPFSTPTTLSPIKSTISITYKSPVKSQLSSPLKPRLMENFIASRPTEPQKTLLETAFDENTVYEQVKLLRNSVTAVNEMFLNSRNIEENKSRNFPFCESTPNADSNINTLSDNKKMPQDDISMSEEIDSLEMDQSIYENVELRKKSPFYENVHLKSISPSIENKSETDSLECDQKENEVLEIFTPALPPPQKSPSSFSVKQLATKFETSPIEIISPAFDFSQASNNRKILQNTQNKSKQLSKYTQHTRSLDENAFVREFGRQKRNVTEDLTKSVHQIDEKKRDGPVLQSIPKYLNPPKRLPGITDCKEKLSGKLKLDLEKVEESSPKNYRDIRITPTTENRICLIQKNVLEDSTHDEQVPINLSNSLKVLSGVKLDRDRIERIKEERRHQLNEKYRTESFKSKSKTELREISKDEDKPQSESLRIKSKSRGDVRNLSDSREVDNFKFEGNFICFPNRVRRTSDEKNRNSSDSTTGNLNIIKQNRFERKSVDLHKDRNEKHHVTRSSISSTREKISMFESKSQN